MSTTSTRHYCADCRRSPRDGVRLRELRLLTDPPGTLKHLCDGDDEASCLAIIRSRRSSVPSRILT